MFQNQIQTEMGRKLTEKEGKEEIKKIKIKRINHIK